MKHVRVIELPWAVENDTTYYVATGPTTCDVYVVSKTGNIRKVSTGATSGAGHATLVAASTVSGHRVVKYATATEVSHADSDAASLAVIAGVSTNAAVTGGEVDVVTSGMVEHAGWAFTPGAPVFCGALGVPTQTPTSVALRQVGVAISATAILVEIGPLIIAA